MALGLPLPAISGYEFLHHVTVDVEGDWPIEIGEDIVHTITVTNVSNDNLSDHFLFQRRDEVLVAYQSDCEMQESDLPGSPFDGVLIRYPDLTPGDSATCDIRLKYVAPSTLDTPHWGRWSILIEGGTEFSGGGLSHRFAPETPIVLDADGLRSLYWDNGSDWNRSDGWLGEYGTECDWYGITCNENRTKVVEISLPDNNIRSTIQIGRRFASIERIDLSGNDITTLLGEWVRNLNASWINLSDNNVFGPLPNGVFRSPTLRYLDLSQNRLDADLPDEVAEFSPLEFLDLSDNRLVGDLPKTIGNASHLRVLDLSANKLEGDVARLDLPSSIEEVYLNENYLTGGLPRKWRSLPNLSVIDLCRNVLSKRIPAAYRVPSDEQQLNELRICFNSIGGAPLETDEYLVDDTEAYGTYASLSQDPEGYCEFRDRRGQITLRWDVESGRQLELWPDGQRGRALRTVQGTGEMRTGAWVESGRRFFLIDPLTEKIHAHHVALRVSLGCPDVRLNVQPFGSKFCGYPDWDWERRALKARRQVIWDVTDTNTQRVGIYLNDNDTPWVVGGPTGQVSTGYWNHSRYPPDNALLIRFSLRDEDTGQEIDTARSHMSYRECNAYWPHSGSSRQ